MKLWGVAMVRNESDIVEAFVRHNLTVLDGMVVVDHGSSDATLAILTALCNERLPLVVKRIESPGYLQAEVVTTAAREAFAAARADAVFPLDADEFLRVPSRPALEQALLAIPPNHYARIEWPTYIIPSRDAHGDIFAMLRTARRTAGKQPYEREVQCKAILTASFAGNPAAVVGMGNHGVILGRDPATAPRMAHVDLPESLVEVCHVPLRNPAQFVIKTTVKRLARIAANRDYAPTSAMRIAFDALVRGEMPTAVDMLATHLTREAAASEVVDRRLPSAGERFLADFELRHTPPMPADPLPVVLAAVDHLVARLVAARRAGASARPGAR
jgi:hypothetical protein